MTSSPPISAAWQVRQLLDTTGDPIRPLIRAVEGIGQIGVHPLAPRKAAGGVGLGEQATEGVKRDTAGDIGRVDPARDSPPAGHRVAARPLARGRSGTDTRSRPPRGTRRPERGPQPRGAGHHVPGYLAPACHSSPPSVSTNTPRPATGGAVHTSLDIGRTQPNRGEDILHRPAPDRRRDIDPRPGQAPCRGGVSLCAPHLQVEGRILEIGHGAVGVDQNGVEGGRPPPARSGASAKSDRSLPSDRCTISRS